METTDAAMESLTFPCSFDHKTKSMAVYPWLLLTKLASKNRLTIAREAILLKQVQRNQKLHRFLIEKEVLDKNMELLSLNHCDPKQLME